MDNNKLEHFDSIAAKSKPNFSLVSSIQLTSGPRPNDWLIKGLIERGNLGLIFGKPENGKSLFTLDMAFCVATGTDFFGRKVKQGSVIYLAGEGHSGLSRRIKVLELKYGVRAPKLYISEMPADLMSPENARGVRDALDNVCSDATLVIIDTLHRNFGAGDENSAKDFGIFCQNLDNEIKKEGEAILVVHHSGHGDDHRSRGSSSIKAAMDIEYLVAKSKDSINVTCTKAKDIDNPGPMHFDIFKRDTGWINEDGDSVFSAILMEDHNPLANAENKPKALSKNTLKVLETLKSAIEKHGITPPPEVLNYLMESNQEEIEKVVHISNWRDEVLPLIDVKSDKRNSKNQAFGRAREALLEHKKIGMYNDFFWMPLDLMQISIDAMIENITK